MRQIIYPRADQAGATPDAGSKPEVLNAKRTENPDEDSAEGLGLNEQAEAAGLFRKAMDTAMRMLALRFLYPTGCVQEIGLNLKSRTIN